MRALDRYIGTSFLWGFLFVLLILAMLFSFLELVAQLDDVGRGNFAAVHAFLFVGLTMPKRILDLVPLGALLGSIIALGMLAERGELIAMRAAGLSVGRICFSVITATGLLMLATAAIAEYVAPTLEQQALARRSLELSGSRQVLWTKQGFWARHGQSFIRVGRTLPGGIAADLDLYERDEEGRLTAFIHAQEADIHDDKGWVLRDITQKVIEEQKITTYQLASLTLDSFLSAEQVSILELPPESLSPTDLYLYIKALRARGQNADQYLLALWQKLAVPLATGAMVLLSLPFVFGPPRGTPVALRIVIGSLVGIAFYLANQIIGYLGLLFELNPAITTLTPIAVILWLAFWRLGKAL